MVQTFTSCITFSCELMHINLTLDKKNKICLNCRSFQEDKEQIRRF
jgi:hypothetical protein